MDKKRAVFLFGAGAVLDWGGPRTICGGDKLTFLPEHNSPHIVKNRVCCLTHLMRETGFKSKNGKKIAENIYQQLTNNSLGTDPANFEAIINFIDEVFTYFGDSRKNNLFSSLGFPAAVKDELFNYICTENPDKSFNLSVPEFEFYNDRFQSEIIPEQQFAGWLLDDLLKGIHGHVSKYSYHTPTYNVIFSDGNETNNKLFCNWVDSFKNDYVIRMYTLNYDRLFNLLLENHGMKIFEGFLPFDPAIGYFGRYKADISRIQNDIDSNICYNLHGCITWDLEAENVNQLPGYEYYLTIAPVTKRMTSAIIEIEKGKKLLLANIITGYQKVQRTALAPFRQMLSAFDRDCTSADEMFIIGYSYADEHINDIIRNAKKQNPSMKITLINPLFEHEQFMFDFILHWEALNRPIYEKEGDNIISKQFNIRAIKRKFSDYLSMVANTEAR